MPPLRFECSFLSGGTLTYAPIVAESPVALHAHVTSQPSHKWGAEFAVKAHGAIATVETLARMGVTHGR